MPRYDIVNLEDYRLLNNTVPVRNRTRNWKNEQLSNYTNLGSDLQVNWSGDLIIDEQTQDLKITTKLDAYAQRVYHRLITQLGQFPENETFGWNFEYLYSVNIVEQRRLLPKIINDIKNSVGADEDTLSVQDVTAQIQRTSDQQHNIIIFIIARPKTIQDSVQLVFSLNTTEA